MTTTTTPAPQLPELVGPIGHRFRRDEEGHRFYEIDWHVRTFDQHENIAWILQNWPLFNPGDMFMLVSLWPETAGFDEWAFCTPELNIAAHPDVRDNGPVKHWVITQYWSTKQTWRCNLFPIENPLLEPYEITGDYIHEQRQARVDRFGKALKFPNFETITGPATEYKYSHPTITISYNQATLPLATITLLINKVNDAELWGLEPRKIKFSDAKFERRVYGSCFYYWHVSYTFEFDEKGFDVEVPFFGTKEYNGSGSIYDPKSFDIAKTESDQNDAIPLDSVGRKLRFIGLDVNNNPQYLYPQHVQTVELLEEGNFLLLGIPGVLDGVEAIPTTPPPTTPPP